eukprot:scaffold2347_cov173-Amphora_coffeaeformis.AAC.7
MRMRTTMILSFLWLLVALAQMQPVTSLATPTPPVTTTPGTGAAAGSATPTRPRSIPPISPATGLPNQFYTWREDMSIRYQTAGPVDAEPMLLVHGLFVNADHWRKTIDYMANVAGYRVYALDLFGCGYSDKPPRDSDVAQRCNGENGRFDNDENNNNNKPSILRNVKLGTANGQATRVVDVDLRHPLNSPYNFFTWSELLTDFSRDVILRDKDNNKKQQVTLVSNSIGTISALQAVLDTPDLYNGVFVVCPNFRELHSAELPFSQFSMPLIRKVQQALRDYGQAAFDFLAKPDTVKQILREPYAIMDAIDDTLVQVLLDPLLTPGASDVVFDTLSYSAGPLPEQQLQEFPPHKPVWVCYGDQDPWTPGPRVEALAQYPAVETVVRLSGVGHCPHDEAPEQVHPLLVDFMQRLKRGEKEESSE